MQGRLWRALWERPCITALCVGSQTSCKGLCLCGWIGESLCGLSILLDWGCVHHFYPYWLPERKNPQKALINLWKNTPKDSWEGRWGGGRESQRAPTHSNGHTMTSTECVCGKVCKNPRSLKIHQTKMNCPRLLHGLWTWSGGGARWPISADTVCGRGVDSKRGWVEDQSVYNHLAAQCWRKSILQHCCQALDNIRMA